MIDLGPEFLEFCELHKLIVNRRFGNNNSVYVDVIMTLDTILSALDDGKTIPKGVIMALSGTTYPSTNQAFKEVIDNIIRSNGKTSFREAVILSRYAYLIAYRAQKILHDQYPTCSEFVLKDAGSGFDFLSKFEFELYNYNEMLGVEKSG